MYKTVANLCNWCCSNKVDLVTMCQGLLSHCRVFRLLKLLWSGRGTLVSIVPSKRQKLRVGGYTEKVLEWFN